MAKKRYFTDKDISRIARLTESNRHTEARLFIAMKIKSKTTKGYRDINSAQNRIGYLTPELSKKRNKLDKKLITEFKKISHEEYEKVSGAL